MKKLLFFGLLLLSIAATSQEKMRGNFVVAAQNEETTTLLSALNCKLVVIAKEPAMLVGSEYFCSFQNVNKAGRFYKAELIGFVMSEGELHLQRRKVYYNSD